MTKRVSFWEAMQFFDFLVVPLAEPSASTTSSDNVASTTPTSLANSTPTPSFSGTFPAPCQTATRAKKPKASKEDSDDEFLKGFQYLYHKKVY